MVKYLVYKATSPSNKFYIGITKKTLLERQKEHEYAAKSNSKKRVLYSAMQKHECNFKWEELGSNLTVDVASDLEIHYIMIFNTTDRNFGYNMTKGGLSGDIMSIESKVRYKQSMKKYYDDPAYVKKITERLRESSKIGFQTWLKKDDDSVKQWKLLCSENLKKVAKNREYRLMRSIAKGGKPFYCKETGEVFEMLQDAADRFGVDKRNIHGVLKHPQRYKTILKKYTFEYVEKEI